MAENEKNTQVEEVKKDSKKPVKSDKVPFTTKIGNFFRACKSELKKIVWYSKKDTFNSTLLVVIVLIVCSAAISILDFGFAKVIELLASL